MINTLKSLNLSAAQSERYWRYQATFNGLKFKIKRQVYNTKRKYRTSAKESTIFRSLISQSFLPILLPLALTTILQITSSCYKDFFADFSIEIINKESYATLLGIITSVSGLFLGLYFTAIASITSVAYVNVPNNIRNLITSDRLSQTYYQFLGFVTVFGICLLTMHVLGKVINPLSVFLLVIAASISTFSFIFLIKRTFDLFNPVTLVHYPIEHIRESIMRVSSSGEYWNDPSFQQHEHNIAVNQIEVIKNLLEVVKKNTHLQDGDSLEICKHIRALLYFYASKKYTIPSDSNWFQMTYQHRDWYSIGDYDSNFVHPLAGVQPKINRNEHWFEEKLFELLFDSLTLDFKNKNYANITNVIGIISGYLEFLIGNGQVELTLKFYKDTIDQCIKEIPGKHKIEDLNTLSIYEQLSILPIRFILNYLQYLEHLSFDELTIRLNKISWKNKSSVYSQGFSRDISKQLEWFYDRIKFETSIEERTTPLGYVRAKLLIIHFKTVEDHLKTLLDHNKNLFLTLLNETENTSCYWLYGTVLSRKQEYLYKLEVNLHRYESYAESLFVDLSFIDGDKPETNIQELYEGIESDKTSLVDPAKLVVEKLLDIDRDQTFPDFSGQFLHYLSECLIDSIVTNDFETFGNLFGFYFINSYKQFSKLLPKNIDPNNPDEFAFRIAIGPLIDLLEMSGIGILISKYYENTNIENLIKLIWDRHLSGNEVAIQQLSAVIGYADGVFTQANREKFRFEWMRKVRALFTTISADSYSEGNSFFHEPIFLHDNPLVRLFCEDRIGGRYNGLSVFITYVIFIRDDIESLDFRRDYRDLSQSIVHEEERYQNYKDQRND